VRLEPVKEILLFFMLGLLLGGLFGAFVVSAQPSEMSGTRFVGVGDARLAPLDGVAPERGRIHNWN
jgi:hypothetical protein